MFKILARRPLLLSLALPTIFVSTASSSAANPLPPTERTPRMANASWPTKPYSTPHPHWPYTPSDFDRTDPGPDTTFYQAPRFVNHIDDNAIALLRQYYDRVLPASGRILELCSSWVSHLPDSLQAATELHATPRGAETAPVPGRGLAVTGYGMNKAELDGNPVLAKRVVKDFNVDPELAPDDKDASFDAAACVVSIDYLVKPREVLASVLEALKPGASVHLVISNRCFPTKVVKRWLRISEEERLAMVGDYLAFAGYENIEIVTLEDGKGTGWFQSKDPLWVVRGTKPQL